MAHIAAIAAAHGDTRTAARQLDVATQAGLGIDSMSRRQKLRGLHRRSSRLLPTG